MTDAYEDLFQPSNEHDNDDVVAASASITTTVANSPPHRRLAAYPAGEREPWSARLAAAEQRRQEFRAWLLHRARHSAAPASGKTMERAAAEERRARRLERIQERLAAAEANRAATLAELQRRAAATSQRREGAAERAAAAVAERTAVAAERLEADLAAAESRRLALREAERERLRAEHELVLARLVTSHERAAEGAERQRSRLESRLRTAASQREARLARRVARAAGKVERARQLGALSREQQQLEVESRRQALERKLETARQRRQERRALAPGSSSAPAVATSPSSGSPSRAVPAVEHAADPNINASDVQVDAAEPAIASQAFGVAAASVAAAAATATAAVAGAGSDTIAVPTAPGALPLLDAAAKAGDLAAAAIPPAIVVTAEAALQGPAELASLDAATVPDLVPPADSAPAVDLAVLEGLRRSLSSRRLQKGWRAFVQSRKTTRALAEAFVAQGVTGLNLPPSSTAGAQPEQGSGAVGAAGGPRLAVDGARKGGPAALVVGPAGAARMVGAGGAGVGARGHSDGDGDGFDRFARALRSPTTLKATQALMRRLEQRLNARQPAAGAAAAPGGKDAAAGSSQVRARSVGGDVAAAGSAGGAAAAGSKHSGGGGGGGAVAKPTGAGPSASSATRLLRRLFPQAPRDAVLERYPPRVLLCAFMVVRHPEVVFSGSGPRESALAAASRDVVDRFEALLEWIIVARAGAAGSGSASASGSEPTRTAGGEPPSSPSPAASDTEGVVAASPVARGMEELMAKRRRAAAAAAAAAAGGGTASGRPAVAEPVSPSKPSPYMTIGSLLVQFDESWLRYLDQFVAWKGADAASLESELVRCAAALETSMLRKCRGNPTSERVRRSIDLQAVIAQVAHDQELLRERVARLGGDAGLARLEAALEAARRAVAAEIAERGSGSASASASASVSEADTTDVESPARRSPSRKGAARTAAAPAGRQTTATTSPPPPLAIPVYAPPVAAPTPMFKLSASTTPVANPASAGNADAGAGPVGPPRTAAATPPMAIPRGSTGSAPERRGLGGGDDGVDAEAAGAQDTSTPQALSASPRSPGSLSAAALSRPAPLDAALVSNAALVHEMLLGPATGSYRLPAAEAEAAWQRALTAVEKGSDGLTVLAPGLSPEELQGMDQEQLIRTLRSRTAAIAECAFWDNVTSALAAAMHPHQPRPESGGGATDAAAVSRLAAVLAPLLSEMAQDVASVVNSQQQAAAIRSQFNEAALRTEVQGGGSPAAAGPAAGTAPGGGIVAAAQRFLGPLERLAALLVAAGAPAREVAALAAHEAMRAQLTAALTETAAAAAGSATPAVSAGADVDGSSDDAGEESPLRPQLRRQPPPPVASALGRALRLLAAQVKLLKLDAANGRLQALAAVLPGDAAVAYLRSKFSTIFNLPSASASDPNAAAGSTTTASGGAGAAAAVPLEAVALPRQAVPQALPRTAAWLRLSHTGAAGIEQYLRSQGVDIQAAVASVTASGGRAPVHLRTGRLRAPPGGAGGDGASGSTSAPIRVAPVVPVGPGADPRVGGVDGWRWVVRCGLAALVSSSVPAVGPALAETLLWDGERLHAAQNEFQQLVVVTAGLLLVTQLRGAAAAAARAGAPDAAAGAAAAAAAAVAWGPAARAAAARRLLVVVADPGMRLPELTTELAALAGVAGDEAAEARLRGAFMTLVDPSSAAFRSLTNALAASVLLHLVLGPGDGPAADSTATAAVDPSGMTVESGAAKGTAASPAGPAAGPAAGAVSMLLGRVGASGLAGDVAALGQRLLAICAVNEAVHADVYGALYDEILRDEQRQGQREQQQQQRQHRGEGGPTELLGQGREGQGVLASSAAQGGSGQAPGRDGREEEGRLAEGDEI